MVSKLQKIFGRLRHPIAKNFLSLAFVQATNYLLPLLVIPLIIRNIGIANFGRVSFCQAIMMSIATFVDYGFNLTSTREISLARNDLTRISFIFNTTVVTKMILTFLSFIVWCAVVVTVPSFNEHQNFYLTSFLFVVGQSLVPVWLFQGLDKMFFITVLNLISKSISFLGILMFVRVEQDYVLVLPVLATGGIVSGVSAFILIKVKFGVTFSRIKFSLPETLKQGATVFFANAAVTTYNSLATIILSFFSSDYVVGCFSTAEKVVQVPRQILSVYSQSLYPTICQLSKDEFHAAKQLLKKSFFLMIFSMIAICGILFVIASDIAVFLTGGEVILVESLIRYFLIVPLVISFNVPFYLLLLAYNQTKYLLRALSLASLLGVGLSVILGFLFSAYGIIGALALTEVLIVAFFLKYLKSFSSKGIMT